MKLRQNQIQQLAEVRSHVFRKELVRMLQRDFPDAIDGGQEPLRAFVDASCNEAQSVGLRTEGQLRAWTQLRVIHGADFTLLDWVAPILNDRSLTPNEKLTLIDERATMIEAMS